MQHGEDVVEQVLHAQTQAVQVALRRVRQVGTALLSAAVKRHSFFMEPGGKASRHYDPFP